MANYGEQLISKIVDDNDIGALIRYSITESDFATDVEKRGVRFVLQHADANKGQAPSYATLVGEIDGFTYIPAVTDSYEFLAKRLKDASGKRLFAEWFESGEISQKFTEKSAEDFGNYLREVSDRITMGTQVRVLNFKTLDTLRHEFRAEYEKRKDGRSFKLWKTPFESLNAEIGGLYSGDIYGVMAESGRGKSYLIACLVDELLRQGAKVLVKSYELKAYLWLSRLLSIITAREGALDHDELAQKVGIPNKAILSGQLDGEIETYFLSVVDALNEYYPGALYLQAKGDRDLTRTLADLDRELQQNPEIDVCVIDPFYGLSDIYGSNVNKTAGGAAEQAARKFEQIIGANDVVGIFAIQASSTEKSDADDEGRRELKLPRRDQVKTTKAVLEIATNLFAFDAVDGNGRIGVEKGRNGGEGFAIDLLALMDYGVLRELPKGTEAAAQFVSNF
ncbi:DNA helicase [Paenibacillus sp. HWE-109]|uniref:DnaB-like helicase C-terminal domain-containing protein n=1 Tax=Paenibacillus sp. HWE-109 TaxID=1306526 RepID=UPI001EE09ADE|nr:DnaB-like helicase C-terminal domain-containing protein [Paenibacillus sp. HWE-109]UKS30214.1 DNA helicase [Paenibacillus sp. HWE-109]